MGLNESTLGYSELNENQKNLLISTQIIVGMFTGFLIAVSFYNTYTYLIKQQKYKIAHILIFYVTSILSLSLIMIMVFKPPLFVNPCEALLFISVFGVSYLNVILGIGQASMLTILYI